jgi:hypothetical protein
MIARLKDLARLDWREAVRRRIDEGYGVVVVAVLVVALVAVLMSF